MLGGSKGIRHQMNFSDHIVIVYGALRSGTTLLRLMLNNHPKLSCPGEADFLFDHLSKDKDGHWLIDRGALRRNRIFQQAGITCADNLAPIDTVNDMVAQLHAKGGKLQLIVMSHRAISKAMDLYPQTPIIHMLRDPRDVARSSIGMGWAGDVFHGVRHWIKTEREWAQYSPNLPPKQHVALHYESLIRDPQKELTRILEFLGLPYDKKMLSYGTHSSYSAPDVGLIEQWRHKQTPYEIGMVEHQVGDLLEATEYTPSGHPSQNPRGHRRLLLVATNKVAVWKERARRFGLKDSLIVAIAQKSGFKKLGYPAQVRINKKTKAFLK